MELQQELVRFFDELRFAVDAAKESRSRIRAGRQQELEDFFGGLTSEVEAELQVASDQRRHQAEGIQQDLTGMFALLEPTLTAAAVAIRVMEEREQEQQDRRTGRKFSPFNLVRTQELDLSRIFAGLLRPSGDHSQGDLFLSLLLEELNVGSKRAAELLRDFQPSGDCRSRLEYPIANEAMLPGQEIAGSIDIVLELEGNFWIGIENKPSAEDQPWQVDRYLFALVHEAEHRGGSEEQVILLYWSGDGTDPDLSDLRDLKDTYWDEETTRKQERLRSRCFTVPYRERPGFPSVEGWLRRCCSECETERVQSFLHDLLKFIKNQFGVTLQY